MANFISGGNLNSPPSNQPPQSVDTSGSLNNHTVRTLQPQEDPTADKVNSCSRAICNESLTTNLNEVQSSLKSGTPMTPLEKWVAEAPELEQSSRKTAKLRIENFIASDGQERVLDLSDLSLTTLPDVWDSTIIKTKLDKLILNGTLLSALPITLESLKPEAVEIRNIEKALLQSIETASFAHFESLLPYAKPDNLAWTSDRGYSLFSLAIMAKMQGKEKNESKDILSERENIIKSWIHKRLDVNLQTKHGTTPLMLAIVYHDEDTVKALLKRQDCDINLSNSQGKTAMQIAQQHSTPPIEELISKRLLFETSLKDWVDESPQTERLSRNTAANRIKEAFFGDKRELSLMNLGLTSLPDSMQSLTNLKELNLDLNPIGTIPDWIGQLDKLENLLVWKCQLSSLPDSMQSLKSLTHLDLGSNSIGTIPDWIGQLDKLEWLSVRGCGISSPPDSMQSLKSLTHLDLSSNSIGTIPEWISQLDELGWLSVERCGISSLPDSMQSLKSLTYLNLSFNSIHTIPNWIDAFQNISWIQLINNRLLTSLPTEIFNLRSNSALNVGSCGLSRAVINRINALVAVRGYRGPKFFFSLESVEDRFRSTTFVPSIKSANDLLDDFCTLANTSNISSEQKKSFWSELSKDPEAKKALETPGLQQKFETNGDLHAWLSRISYMADFNANGGANKTLVSAQALRYVTLAIKDPAFRETFFAMITDAGSTCGDRVALSLLHLSLAEQLTRLSSENPKDIASLATLLIRGGFVLQKLEEIAQNKVKSLPMVDEIEVYLGYPIKLKEKLGIPIDVQEMLYFRCSGLKEEDIQFAGNLVETELQNSAAVASYLSSQDRWIEALRLSYPEKMAALEKIIEDGDAAAFNRYKEGLQKLTLEALKTQGWAWNS